MTTTMKVQDIKVENRHRKDVGDLTELAESMNHLGLLQALPVRPDGVLIAGERRLAAARSLGWEEIDVQMIEGFEDAADLVRAERDENTCRKAMTPSELVAVGKRLEELERPNAQARTLAGKRLSDPGSGGQTRDAVGEALGMSGMTYQRAKTVVDATEHPDPAVAEVARAAVVEMDRSGKIRPAYEKVKAAQLPEAPKPRPRSSLRVVESVLRGVAIAAEQIDTLDDSVTPEEAARLSGEATTAQASLRRINSLLAKRAKATAAEDA